MRTDGVLVGTEEVQLQPSQRASVALCNSPGLVVDIGGAGRGSFSHALGVDAADRRQRSEPDLAHPASLDSAGLSLGQLCRGMAERRLHHFLLQYSLCRLAQRGGRTLFLLNCGLCLFPASSFPAGPLWFVIVLSTMMLPMQVTLIPLFMIFSWLEWVNTFKPLVVPLFFGDAFSIFLLRQFFLTLPRELDDAALIDGCSRFAVFMAHHPSPSAPGADGSGHLPVHL